MSDIIASLQAETLAARGGGVHAMSIGPQDVHIDTALSNLAVAYRPNEGKYIADVVMPVVKVTNRSDKYFKFAPSTFLDLSRVNIASQMGRPAQVSWNVSQDSYAVLDFGLVDFVPVDVDASADAPLRPLMDATEILTERLMIAREYRVAATVNDSANYGSNVLDLAGGQQWDNPGSDPVKQIETAIRTPVVTPNALVLGYSAWASLKRHPAIERYIISRAATSVGATPLTVTPELFAQAFELDKVIVGKAKYGSGNPGAAFAQTYLWGTGAALLRIEPQPAMQRTEAFGYTFRYAPNGGSFETRTWFDMSIGVRGGTWVKVTHSDIEKPVAGQYAGYLFQNTVSA